MYKNRNFYTAGEGSITRFSMFVLQKQEKRNYCLTIGQNSIIGGNFTITGGRGVSIGNNCYIGDSKFFCHNSKITIDDFAVISFNCTFYTHNSHSLSYLDRVEDIELYLNTIKEGKNALSTKTWENVKEAPIYIGKHAWIGFNCIILKGVSIGEGAIVGAGSVVTKDVPPFSVVAGNPARVVKMLK